MTGPTIRREGDSAVITPVRKMILGHIAQIIATPWRDHPPAARTGLRRRELDAYAALLAREGRHTDPEVMRALDRARAELGAS